MRASVIILSALAAGVSACGPPQYDVREDFTATGELVALGGGTAGAKNACFTCHGMEGGGNGAGVPRLAGLNAGYIQHQMVAYADGRRTNPSMRWIAKQLSARETLLVSGHYARQDWTQPSPRSASAPPEIFVAGDPSRDIPACASCHGSDGMGQGQAIPPLAGQPQQYLAQQLHLWKRGERRSDPDDVMLEIARSLTPEEVAELSAFASSLPGGVPRPEPPEAFPSERRSDPRSDASMLPRRVAGS